MNVVPSIAWGLVLAHYSWMLLIYTTLRALDTITHRRPSERSRRWIGWLVGKWLLYAVWIWFGLTQVHLSGLWMGLGFLVGWTTLAVYYGKYRRTPFTGVPSVERENHGAV